MDFNDLALTLEDFSDLACLDGALFGMTTICDTCETTFNDCMRNQVRNKLRDKQALVENIVGFNLTPRYHEEEIDWDGSAYRVQLRWPGISELSVIREYSEIEDFGPFTVDPYTERNITITDSGAGYCIAEFDAKLIPNPNNAIFRDDDDVRLLTVKKAGFPRRVDGKWQIALDKGVAAPACSDVVNVQDCRFIAVNVGASPACQTLVAVYPGTDEVIPFAKPSTVIDGDTYYWFYAWSLIDKAFSDELMDYSKAEFYKLLETVEFRCVESIDSLPQLMIQSCDGCGDAEFSFNDEVQLEVIDAENSIIYIRATGSLCSEQILRVKIYYATTPENTRFQEEIPSLEEAIAYLTAAELTMEACGCEVTKGFIKTAQESYDKVVVNPFDGNVYANKIYGNLYGQRIFTERVDRARKHYILRSF